MNALNYSAAADVRVWYAYILYWETLLSTADVLTWSIRISTPKQLQQPSLVGTLVSTLFVSAVFIVMHTGNSQYVDSDVNKSNITIKTETIELLKPRPRPTPCSRYHRCNKRFYVFLFRSRFLRF